jgi:hypothetical protein
MPYTQNMTLGDVNTEQEQSWWDTAQAIAKEIGVTAKIDEIKNDLINEGEDAVRAKLGLKPNVEAPAAITNQTAQKAIEGEAAKAGVIPPKEPTPAPTVQTPTFFEEWWKPAAVGAAVFGISGYLAKSSTVGIILGLLGLGTTRYLETQGKI